MSLLDRLLAIDPFPPSHHASGNVLELVGKLIAFAEHGDALFEAFEADVKAREAGEPVVPSHVDQLLSGIEPDEIETVQAQPAGVDDSAELRARIAALEQENQTLLAQQQRTTTSVEPIDDSLPGAASPTPPLPGEGAPAGDTSAPPASPSSPTSGSDA